MSNNYTEIDAFVTTISNEIVNNYKIVTNDFSTCLNNQLSLHYENTLQQMVSFDDCAGYTGENKKIFLNNQ